MTAENYAYVTRVFALIIVAAALLCAWHRSERDAELRSLSKYKWLTALVLWAGYSLGWLLCFLLLLGSIAFTGWLGLNEPTGRVLQGPSGMPHEDQPLGFWLNGFVFILLLFVAFIPMYVVEALWKHFLKQRR